MSNSLEGILIVKCSAQTFTDRSVTGLALMNPCNNIPLMTWFKSYRMVARRDKIIQTINIVFQVVQHIIYAKNLYDEIRQTLSTDQTSNVYKDYPS